MSDQRSGSTLLENILSHSPDIVSVGELRLLDSYLNKGKWGRTFDWQCSCGSEFPDCPFWSEVLTRLQKKGITKIEKTSVIKSRNYIYSKQLKSINLPKNYEIINLVDTIYESIFEVSEKKYIVDSSKDEMQLAALLKHSKFKIKVIFLKRDIRAVGLSKHKWQQVLTKKQTNIFKLLIATKIKRSKQNMIFKTMVKKSDRVDLNYSFLAKNVSSAIIKIAKFCGISYYEAPTYFEMQKNHSVAGTPNRETKLIRYDDSWKKKIVKRPVYRLIGKVLDIL